MDGTKRAFVCKKCGSWAYASKSWSCAYDGTEMEPIPYDLAQWEHLSAKDQNSVIRHWMNTSIWIGLSNIPVEVRKEFEQEMAEYPASNAHSTLWITLLRGAAYVILILGILSSLVYGIMLLINGKGGVWTLGVIVIIGGCLLSVLSIAGIMVFLDMAADIRILRVLMESSRKK